MLLLSGLRSWCPGAVSNSIDFSLTMTRWIGILLCLALAVLTFTGLAYSENRALKSRANVYELPNTNAVILDILTPGMTVELVRMQGAWAQIRMPGTAEMGWIENMSLAEPGYKGQAGRPSAARSAITDSELKGIVGRLYSMDQNLQGLEDRVDRLMVKLSPQPPPSQAELKMPRAPVGREKIGAGEVGIEMTRLEPGKYPWRNFFILGKYFKGNEDFYGLGVSRLLDQGGHNWVDAEIQYAVGGAPGKADDFIQWSLGFSFSLKPQSYRIYPFLGAHFGMRHLVDGTANPDRYLVCMPGLGVIAELNHIFSLAAGARAVFLFDKGNRIDEGRASFSCLYRW